MFSSAKDKNFRLHKNILRGFQTRLKDTNISNSTVASDHITSNQEKNIIIQEDHTSPWYANTWHRSNLIFASDQQENMVSNEGTLEDSKSSPNVEPLVRCIRPEASRGNLTVEKRISIPSSPEVGNEISSSAIRVMVAPVDSDRQTDDTRDNTSGVRRISDETAISKMKMSARNGHAGVEGYRNGRSVSTFDQISDIRRIIDGTPLSDVRMSARNGDAEGNEYRDDRSIDTWDRISRIRQISDETPLSDVRVPTRNRYSEVDGYENGGSFDTWDQISGMRQIIDETRLSEVSVPARNRHAEVDRYGDGRSLDTSDRMSGIRRISDETPVPIVEVSTGNDDPQLYGYQITVCNHGGPTSHFFASTSFRRFKMVYERRYMNCVIEFSERYNAII